MNDQTILHVINIWLNGDIENISYPSTVNKIVGYLDARISPTSVRYIISIYKEMNTKLIKERVVKGVIFLGY